MPISQLVLHVYPVRIKENTWRCSSVVPAGNGVGDPTESPWQNGVMEHCLQPCAMKSQASEEELFVKAKKR